MKNLYLATRALLKTIGGWGAPLSDWSISNEAQRRFRIELHNFERSNRGHQHLLGLPFKRWQQTSTLSAETRTAQVTSYESAYRLLAALLDLSEKDFPVNAEFEAAMTSTDATGMLEHAYELLLKDGGWRNLPAGFRVSTGGFETKGEEQLLTLNFTTERESLRASRTLILTKPTCPCLRECSRAIHRARHAIQKLCDTIAEQPEFSQERREKLARDRIRSNLDHLIQGYSTEERQLLEREWGSFKPSALLRAGTKR